MKIKIQLKDPDGVYESIQAAVESSIENASGLDDNEIKELLESRRKKIEGQCEPWIECGEYVTIEIDTDDGTATVCKTS